jgi:5-methylcytosine-specific restriction endonuclease McrA
MPTLTAIVEYWKTDRTAEAFPNLRAHVIGWNNPHCFRCGWLTPLPGKDEKPSKRARPVWQFAAGWLQKAHLAERFSGGPDLAENLVPMCSLCHRQMPALIGNRDTAIAWINSWDPAAADADWQIATDYAWGGDRYREFPGTKAFLNWRLRIDDLKRRLAADPRLFAAA